MGLCEIELERLVLEPRQYVGIDLSVKGLLVVRDDKASLCVESTEGNTCLEILDQDFVDRLLDNVPCYLGGKFLYSDHANIVGHVVIGDYGPALEGILKVDLVRGEEVFMF